jgi:hypothetical protein
MYASVITLLLTIAAIGAGLMAGFYFAFAGFIMRSLDRPDAESAVDAVPTRPGSVDILHLRADKRSQPAVSLIFLEVIVPQQRICAGFYL